MLAQKKCGDELPEHATRLALESRYRIAYVASDVGVWEGGAAHWARQDRADEARDAEPAFERRACRA